MAEGQRVRHCERPPSGRDALDATAAPAPRPQQHRLDQRIGPRHPSSVVSVIPPRQTPTSPTATGSSRRRLPREEPSPSRAPPAAGPRGRVPTHPRPPPSRLQPLGGEPAIAPARTSPLPTCRAPARPLDGQHAAVGMDDQHRSSSRRHRNVGRSRAVRSSWSSEVATSRMPASSLFGLRMSCSGRAAAIDVGQHTEGEGIQHEKLGRASATASERRACLVRVVENPGPTRTASADSMVVPKLAVEWIAASSGSARCRPRESRCRCARRSTGHGERDPSRTDASAASPARSAPPGETARTADHDDLAARLLRVAGIRQSPFPKERGR